MLNNFYMDYSYNHGIMRKDHGPRPLHADVDERGTLRESQGNIPFGLPFIDGVGSTTSRAIDEAVIICRKNDKFHHFGCQRVSNSAKLMA